MDNIGLDLHKRESQLCILTADGEVVERRIRTSRERFSEVLGARAPAQILLEASTESEWVAQHLESLGHAVIVADPNFARLKNVVGFVVGPAPRRSRKSNGPTRNRTENLLIKSPADPEIHNPLIARLSLAIHGLLLYSTPGNQGNIREFPVESIGRQESGATRPGSELCSPDGVSES
jgi:hypothetical protein